MQRSFVAGLDTALVTDIGQLPNRKRDADAGHPSAGDDRATGLD
ncbi:hypothetical protein [Paragemmobacter ruber]|nr:hypothetical protein [Rhodobacter ruber]